MPAISGTDFVRSLPERPGAERELAILDAVRRGLHLPPVWSELHSEWEGHSARLFVSADALRIGNDDDAIRVNVTAETAQWIGDHLGTILPTTRVCDLVWAQARVRASASIQLADAEMAWTSRMVRHSREVDEKIRCRSGLVANVGKHWVLSNRIAGGGGRAANYGWFRFDGSPIQTLGTAHDLHHVDYSQVVRLVRRDVIVDGRVMDIEAVGRDQQLSGLVSDEGVLRVWRQPGARPLPELADDAAVSWDDPRH